MASTGTHSYFVHPAEAGHGDLGMISDQDAVIALSNSGETAELDAIVAYTRRFKIPLIAIVGRRKCTLAANADHVLALPEVPEACPMGLAPTTSTTMSLALGDALAVALLTRKGFSATDFQDLHPGGHLGRRLVTVRDIMHIDGDVPLVATATPMADAILEMSAKSFGCVGVLDADRRLAGVITDGDLRRHMHDGLLRETADTVMTPHPKVIRADALAAEALWVMNSRAITSLFVAEDRRPVGILHMHGCLRVGVA